MRSSWCEAFARTVRDPDQAAVKPVVVIERRFQAGTQPGVGGSQRQLLIDGEIVVPLSGRPDRVP